MNKDELLKIYSAYFPYKLEVLHVDTDWAEDREITAILTGVFEDCLTFNQASDYYYKDEQIVIKPILYDLSYLTKPIEGGVYVINEIADVISKDQSFSIIQSDDAIILDFDEEYVFHIISVNNMMRQPYEIIQILLKYHFNVFDIPESEYINKATLTNK